MALDAQHSDAMVVAMYTLAATSESAVECEALEFAFTLPGVVLALQRARWPELRPAFDGMLQS